METGIVGETPVVRVHNANHRTLAEREQEKNKEIWSVPDYQNADSPGFTDVARFMAALHPPKHSSILDAGCGRGIAGLRFAELGMEVTYLDITGSALDEKIKRNKFIETPLWANWKTLGRSWDYGFCVDVIEHLPIEYTMLALGRLFDACRVTWLQIALEPDKWGPMILKQPLHQTVMPYAWWLERIESLGKVLDARDLLRTGLYVVERR